jgi:hypothetical protein
MLANARRKIHVISDWFLTYTIGYGYRPGRIVYWLAAALVIATTVFAFMYPQYVKPAKDAPPGKAFIPFLYSLDLLLPVANLGQRGRFVTYGPAEWVPATDEYADLDDQVPNGG